MRRALRVVGGLFIVVVALWAGIRSYAQRSSQRLHTASIEASAGAAGAPLASDAAAPQDLGYVNGSRIPEKLPVFTLGDVAGKATSIAAWQGKSLVLNFWATWCAPCQREIPLLLALHREWAARNVEVIGIAVDNPGKVRSFAHQFNITYPLLVGDQDAMDVITSLGVQSPAFPFTVFTDRRGEVVALFMGELHKPQANLILDQVQQLNQDHTGLAAARRAIADGLSALSMHHSG